MDTEKDRANSPLSDNPIHHPEQDVLGRAALVQSFVRQVPMLDRAEGVVVGILGAWGSGKTSFINLARRELEQNKIPILDFNPWMFSGTKQLIDRFFIELTSQLKARPEPALSSVGKVFEDFGDVLSPWIAPIGVPTKLFGKVLQNLSRKRSVGQPQNKIKDLLRKLDKPILVVLDDIDRLSISEIKDVFRLVRLTANFPNMIYIVAFDRTRVENALTEQGMPGQDYLEKILQVTIDLPTTPDHLLQKHILSAINDAISSAENARPFDEPRWPDIFVGVIRPLLRNMRDVRRYVIAVHGTVSALKGQVALVDVLALEAIRVFLPEISTHLHGMLAVMTATHEFSTNDRNHTQQDKEQIDRLIKAAGTHAQVVRSMIKHLFPAAGSYIGEAAYGREWRSRWIRERRVAHDDILRFYLERVKGDSLQAFHWAEGALTYLADPCALDSYLRSLDKERLQDVIASLKIYEDEFLPEHVVPGTTVLLNLLPDLPERLQRFSEVGAKITITRVTYRLLRSLKHPAAIEEAVRQILPGLNSLSAKMAIIDQIGYKENVGHKLVSREAATEFEKAWRQEVLSASPDTLAKERDFLWILYFAKAQSDPSEPPFDIDLSPELTLHLLRSAWIEAVSQTPGSHAVRRSPRLAWESLVDLYGSEETLGQRIQDLKKTHPEGAGELLELANKYLSGWRPSAYDP